jgi:P27 family predicted phage terminase small subunit
MARPRKVISMSTGKISKAERAARTEEEKKIKVKANHLTAPEWLTDKAAIEFERVVQEASRIDMLDNLDLSVLAIYCDNYARYIEMATYLNLHNPVFETDKGYQMVSPRVTILNQCAKNIFTCSTKLGMAVTDRLKLIVPVKEEKSVNKFVKFLGDGTHD